MADSQQKTAFDIFLSKLPPEKAKQIRNAFNDPHQNREVFLTEFIGKTIQETPNLDLEGHTTDSVLNAAAQEWERRISQPAEQHTESNSPQKGISLSDFFPKHKEGGGGNDKIPPQSSFEDDLQKVQKELLLQKLKAEIEKYKSGGMQPKFLLPTIEQLVGNLSLEKLLSDQQSLIEGIVASADTFNNREADKQNILVELKTAQGKAIQEFHGARQKGNVSDHPSLFDKEQLIKDIYDGILGGSQTTDNVLTKVSALIDEQHKRLRPFTKYHAQQAEGILPPEAFAYLSNLLSEQAIEWTQVIQPSISGYRVAVQQIATTQTITPGKEGGIVPIAPTFMQTPSKDGERSKTRQRIKTAGRKAVNTTKKGLKKLGKKAVKEAAKGILRQIWSFLLANPEVLIVIVAIFAAIMAFIIIFIAIVSLFNGINGLLTNNNANSPLGVSQDVQSIVSVATTIQRCEKAPFGFWIPPTPSCAFSILALGNLPHGDLLSFAINVAGRFPNYQCGQYIWAAQKYILHWPVFPGNVGSVYQWYLIDRINHNLPGYSWIANPDIVTHQPNPANLVAGDIILYGSTGGSDPGHIAIVVTVQTDKFNFSVTEANYHHGAIDIRPTNLFDNLGRGANILGWWRRNIPITPTPKPTP